MDDGLSTKALALAFHFFIPFPTLQATLPLVTLWKGVYNAKWEKKIEKEPEYEGEDKKEPENNEVEHKQEPEENSKDTNDKPTADTSNVPNDWKHLYKERLRAEKEKEFQKVSAESLKFQAKLALQLNRKREFDHAIQYLQNKKSKMTPPEEPPPTPTAPGWHPTPIQRHFNHVKAANPPLSSIQREDIKKKAIHAATHGKFLQTCLEDVQKRNAFAAQLLERYTELSQEVEQRKQQLGKELKRLRYDSASPTPNSPLLSPAPFFQFNRFANPPIPPRIVTAEYDDDNEEY